MYWNFVAIDGVKKNQINTQQDATLKGKQHKYIYTTSGNLTHEDSLLSRPLGYSDWLSLSLSRSRRVYIYIYIMTVYDGASWTFVSVVQMLPCSNFRVISHMARLFAIWVVSKLNSEGNVGKRWRYEREESWRMNMQNPWFSDKSQYAVLLR
jgi:hypothetical protein